MTALNFADKLMTITERHAEEISRQTCKFLRENSKTPWYHSLSEEECMFRAREFFRNLRRIYFCKPPYKELFEYFSKLASKRFQQGVPLEELIYKLIIMRRQIWLFTESKSFVLTGLDLRQSVESINKMIRIFDHGTYAIVKRYEELNRIQTELLIEKTSLMGMIRSWASKKSPGQERKKILEES